MQLTKAMFRFCQYSTFVCKALYTPLKCTEVMAMLHNIQKEDLLITVNIFKKWKLTVYFFSLVTLIIVLFATFNI